MDVNYETDTEEIFNSSEPLDLNQSRRLLNACEKSEDYVWAVSDEEEMVFPPIEIFAPPKKATHFLEHDFRKRMKVTRAKSYKPSEPKPLTQEQNELLDIFYRALEVPEEAEPFFPKAEFIEPERYPFELRKLTEKGFVTASKALEIMSQTESERRSLCEEEKLLDDGFVVEKGVLTQIETQDRIQTSRMAEREHIERGVRNQLETHHAAETSKLICQKPKTVHTIAEAVVEDFDDIDNEMLSILEERIILDNSLETLTQKLNNSQRAAELIESVLVRSSPSKLDTTCIDLEAFSSDEEDHEPYLPNFFEQNHIIETEALENKFINLETKGTQNAMQPCTSGSGNSGFSLGFATATGKSGVLNAAKMKQVAKAFSKEDRRLEAELMENEINVLPMASKSSTKASAFPSFAGFGIASGKSALLNQAKIEQAAKAFTREDRQIEKELLKTVENIFPLTSSNEKSTRLNSFQRAAESIESVPVRSSQSKLDTTCIDLEAFSSDEEDHEPYLPNFFEQTHIIETEALENKFINLETQEIQHSETGIISEFSFVSGTTKEKSSEFPSTVGFATELRKCGQLNAANMKHVRLEAKLPENEINVLPVASTSSMKTSALPSFVGFGIASGKSANVNQAKFNEITKAFDQQDRKLEFDILKNEKKLQTALVKLQTPRPIMKRPNESTSEVGSPLTRNTKTKMIGKILESMKETVKPQTDVNENIFDTPDRPLSKRICLNFNDTPSILSAGAIGVGKIVSANSNGKRLSKDFLKDDGTVKLELEGAQSSRPPLKKMRLNFGESPSSPFLMNRFSKGINLHSTPIASRMETSNEFSSIVQLFSSTDAVAPTRNKPVKSRLLNKFNNSADSEDSFDLAQIESFEETSKMFIIDNGVKALRRQALEEQIASIKEKSDCDRAPMAGSIFMIKSAKNRKTMRQYVNDAEPQNLQRHFVTLNNVIDFKFLMENFVDEKTWKTNTDGVSVGDNARLIINELAKVGISEISSSFLSSPGVDPKLATERWIENAFKMIVFKLASLENSFEAFERFEVLTPENVLLQLKYRYDREKDRNHRSAVKKIVELDEVSCRRMILKVAAIVDTPGTGYELDLTDGWYAIRTKIDNSLADAIDRGKITTGTKLITSFAELVGCSGFDPLELPANVRLKIHGNSTRRVHWDMKMGFSKNPSPILIPLDSVLARGGVISQLRLFVTHVYPIVYVDTSGEKKETRSEAHQKRIQNKLDILNFTLYETVARQVEEEMISSLRLRVEAMKNAKLKMTELTAEQICDFLEYEKESDFGTCLSNEITDEMMNDVSKIREERRLQFKQSVQDKLCEKDRNLSRLLKFRVVDAKAPKKTGLINVWSPSEEILSTITQGTAVEIMKSTAASSGNEIQINTGKSSVIRSIKLNENLETFARYFRKETKLTDIKRSVSPPHNEFDVACVIFHIDPPGKCYQKVYGADEEMNIICINFWSSLSSFAFDNIVLKGNIVFVRNLQWRSSESNRSLPCGFVVHDTTHFTFNPKSEEDKKRLCDIKENIGEISEFLNKMNEKLSTFDLMDESLNKENQKISDASKYSTKDSILQHSVSATSNNSSLISSTPISKKLSKNLGMFKSLKKVRTSSAKSTKSHNRPVFK